MLLYYHEFEEETSYSELGFNILKRIESLIICSSSCPICRHWTT